MKCDELKDYDYDPDFPFQSRGRFYVADEVENAIDELKAEHHKERHEYIKMIAELKQKLEDAKATAYAESVDAGMRERRMKRALWIARALALSRFDVDEYLRKNTHCNSRFWNNGFNTFFEAVKQMQKAINIAEAKCRAKAKEYK